MTTLSIRTPADILAAVPVVMGFQPAESIVMMTFGAVPFHARIDHPYDERDREETIRALLEPSRQHNVPRVLFVHYTAARRQASAAFDALVEAFTRAGIEVVDALVTDGVTFSRLTDPEAMPQPVPDSSVHAFTAQAVADGRVMHGSREQLGEALKPRDVLPELRILEYIETMERRATGVTPMDARWVRETVAACVEQHAAGVPLDDDTLIALIADVQGANDLRDAAWHDMDRENARDRVEFWSEVVRRTPEEFRASPAALLGMAAWCAGHGALAWVAHDLAVAADIDHTLAGLLRGLLENAVNPGDYMPREG
jgi:hypothetical protein